MKTSGYITKDGLTTWRFVMQVLFLDALRNANGGKPKFFTLCVHFLALWPQFSQSGTPLWTLWIVPLDAHRVRVENYLYNFEFLRRTVFKRFLNPIKRGFREHFSL